MLSSSALARDRSGEREKYLEQPEKLTEKEAKLVEYL